MELTAALEQFQQTREMYRSSLNTDYLSFLICGGLGSGKTRLLATCPRPVHIDSFDPGGTTVRTIQLGIKEGWIIVDNRYEKEGFKLWQTEFNRRVMGGYFNHIGTYALDSATTWGDSVMAQILVGGGRKANDIPTLPEYMRQMIAIKDSLHEIVKLPCYRVLTAHLELTKDEITGKVVFEILMTGKSKERSPLLFDEIYVMMPKETSKGVEYNMLTSRTDTFVARTRMGDGLFATLEKPDITALLKKAGKVVIEKPWKPLEQ